jgi:phage shock protein A
LSLAGSRAAQSNADNNIQGSEIARLENRIEAMETNASIMKDLITKEVLEKMASQVKETSTDVTEVLAKLDAQPAVIESSVLERVAEMFTDNIYEIIPGY